VAGQPLSALPLEEVVVQWYPPGLACMEGAGSRRPSFLFVFGGRGGTLVPSLYVFGGSGGGAFSPSCCITQKSLTSWGGRGYPHLRTAVEGLEEGDLQC